MAESTAKYYYYYSKTSYKEQSNIYEKMGKKYKCPKVNYDGKLVSFTNKSTSSTNSNSDAVLVAQGVGLTEF